ncbi:MAG: N-acetylglucosamine-6-phosphate deacetylase [Bacteroidales bacterium]|jgi:N-acetylglucosamine-6-phosphate deacetylase|nr:N-acetylglucosamine-6-phosphate deacetylase [Bacteroidales bacterium]
MDGKRTKIINGAVITPARIVQGQVCVENGKICEIGSGDIRFPDAEVIDAKGNYVSPGFIDLHTHGAGGADFMDSTVEAYLTAVEMHAAHGTTSLYPTTLASTGEELLHTISVYREALSKNKKGAQMLGLHLEGPYFSMNQRGAQDPKYIRNPQPAEYLPILKATNDIARWSAAPELQGSREFAAALLACNILPAIAHTDAIYEEALEAFEWGFTHVTHLYSAMSGVTRRNAYRYAGMVEAAFLIPGMTVELIADGIHLPASLLQLTYQIKGAANIALVTDSMRAAGMPEGASIIGSLRNGQPVIVEDGVAKLPDRSAFAGSTATADRLVRTCLYSAKFPLLQTIQMAASTPARIMGIDKTKGSLMKGKDADIVIFDKDINILLTMVGGRILFHHLQ